MFASLPTMSKRIGAAVAAVAALLCPVSRTQADPLLIGRAEIQGPSGSGISGEALFIETPDADADSTTPSVRTVKIIIRVRGLSPGKHGIHIHETGVCEAPAFTSAGGHFDPGPFGMSNPDANHPFHMGDMPNLNVNSLGVGFLTHTTSRITLSPGPLSVFDANGSAVVVHQNPDQGVTGPAGSGVAGGPRLACGVINRIQ